MFSLKHKNRFSNAFTLVELVLVFAIVSVVVGTGFGAFAIFRDSTIAGNTVEGSKTIIRDAQDKALTVSVENEIDLTPTINNSTFSSLKPQWIYGYSIEYNSSNSNYELYKVIDRNRVVPIDGTNTSLLRAVWKGRSTAPCRGTANLPTSFSQCVLVKSYKLEGSVTANTCNIFFSSVNAIPTITTGSATCYIRVSQPLNKMRLDFIKSSNQDVPTVGDIKICKDNGTQCT